MALARSASKSASGENHRSKSSQLGTLLVEKSLITEQQLAWALEKQRNTNMRLGDILVKEKLISRRELTSALCKQRWLRSAVASLVMVAMPVCPVLAQEKSDTLDFSSQTKILLGNSDNDVRLKLSPTYVNPAFEYADKQDDFKLGIQHSFSKSGAVEFTLNTTSYSGAQIFSPQISLLSSSSRPASSNKAGFFGKGVKRFDRYKDTIPAVYRLTLKGFSLYENDSKTVETWGMNKVKNHPCKDYELMFSITKQF